MRSFESNSSNVPAFLVKLWKLVEDSSCDDLIAWSDNGTSFIIRDQTKFSKELLPQYFKHNNMASFIRQLNMYGFRKVMNYEKTNSRGESDEMEFQHSFFCKGHADFLEHIKRKIPNTKISEPVVKSNPKDILTDLTSIKEKQENMDNMLLKIKQENELLWRELTSMRQKHKAQEQIIQKVIQFLVSIVQRSNQNIGVQRNIPRMLHDIPSKQSKTQVARSLNVLRKKADCFITVPQDKVVSPLGPVIHEVTDLDHDSDFVNASSSLLSEDKANEEKNAEANGNECPLNSSLNSPINTSVALEPLSILEPLELQETTASVDVNSCMEESILGVPLDYIHIPELPASVITIPEKSPSEANSKEDCQPSTSFSPRSVLVYSPLSSKIEYEDPIMANSLNTPQIPVIHIKDDSQNLTNHVQNESSKAKSNEVLFCQDEISVEDNDHNYQLTTTDNSSLVKPSTLTKNTFSNHLLNVEEELNWLQDQISSNTWNIDAQKLLGVCPQSWDSWTTFDTQLFSADDVANNESLAVEIAAENNIKTEPLDIVGNELVQFTPSMLEVEFDIGNSPFLESLNQDAAVPTVSDVATIDQKELLSVLNEPSDQIAASEAAEFLLNSDNVLKQNLYRRPKHSKSQKNKRRKLK